MSKIANRIWFSAACFLFFFLPIFIHAASPTDAYRLYITNILKEEAAFVLSDKSIVHFADAYKKDMRLIMKQVSIGTEVFIFPAFWDPKIADSKTSKGSCFFEYYGADRSQGSHVIAVWVETGKEPLTYVTESYVCIEKAGWFSAAKYAWVCELSDGSKWIIDEPTTFKEGDPIIISQEIDTTNWIIMNPHASEKVIMSKESLKKPTYFNPNQNPNMLRHPYEFVKFYTK